jgi:transcriptional regulator with XRE-family HTH domain
VNPTPLGQFIREQRQLAQLSLREMARMTSVSNAYLSQLERGLHEPSIRVLTALADALDVPVEQLLTRGGASSGAPSEEASVEAAVRQDPRLSAGQKQALLAVYREFAGEEP